MNDKYIFASDGCENVYEDSGAVGYEFRLRIPYYQGVPLSQVKYIRVWMDGEEVPAEDISVFAVTGEEFRLPQILTVTLFYWEYMEPLRVRVYKDGGLAAGRHTLRVKPSIDVIYAPDGFTADVSQEFEI
ncbi:MAG: hypothetical protein J6P87_00070 [Lachnospiraceae bacterium]|nr:hypothetical protein [Lachnospiraceae bacterium]